MKQEWDFFIGYLLYVIIHTVMQNNSVHELWFSSLYMDKEPLVHCTCDILEYPQKMAHQPISLSQVFGLWDVLCCLKFFLCYKGNYQYFNVASHCYTRAWSSDEFLTILMRLCLSFTMIFPNIVQVSFIWPEFLRGQASWARFARNFVKSSLIQTWLMSGCSGFSFTIFKCFFNCTPAPSHFWSQTLQ